MGLLCTQLLLLFQGNNNFATFESITGSCKQQSDYNYKKYT